MKKTFFLFFLLTFSFLFSKNEIPKLSNLNSYIFFKDSIGKHFPIEELKDENGKNFPKDYFKGKITLINLWFTTCAPCIGEIPYLNQLKDQLNDKVNFVGITFHNQEKVNAFLQKHPFNFDLINNVDYKILQKHNYQRFPTNFLLDKEGNIVYLLHNFDENFRDEFLKAFSN